MAGQKVQCPACGKLTELVDLEAPIIKIPKHNIPLPFAQPNHPPIAPPLPRTTNEKNSRVSQTANRIIDNVEKVIIGKSATRDSRGHGRVLSEATSCWKMCRGLQKRCLLDRSRRRRRHLQTDSMHADLVAE
jgi:hypothetical protein